MAVDTRNKRFALMGLAMHTLMVMPNPDTTFNEEADRIQLLRLYAGLLPSGSPGGGPGANAVQIPMKGSS